MLKSNRIVFFRAGWKLKKMFEVSPPSPGLGVFLITKMLSILIQHLNIPVINSRTDIGLSLQQTPTYLHMHSSITHMSIIHHWLTIGRWSDVHGSLAGWDKARLIWLMADPQSKTTSTVAIWGHEIKPCLNLDFFFLPKYGGISKRFKDYIAIGLMSVVILLKCSKIQGESPVQPLIFALKLGMQNTSSTHPGILWMFQGFHRYIYWWHVFSERTSETTQIETSSILQYLKTKKRTFFTYLSENFLPNMNRWRFRELVFKALSFCTKNGKIQV